VAIVGAGFAGIGFAIKLTQRGVRYALIERGASVGGTWRDNTYPGAACDVPSLLYCFSFAPNPDWSRSYPLQAEIRAYLENCVERYGLGPNLRLGNGVAAARFDQARSLWQLNLDDGSQLLARVLIIATGGLSRPKLPQIAGLEDFKGALMHSARWDAKVPLAGRRVGVIGTGASAVQIVPAIVDQVSQLSVFQRSAPWIVRKADRPVSAAARARNRRRPFRQRWRRALLDWAFDLRVLPFTRLRASLPLIEPIVALKRRLEVPDAALRRALKPDYRVGCKRVLLSNDYYPALGRPHVDLVTSPIDRIVADGVRCADGQLRALDVLVLATGFYGAEQGPPFPIEGRDGRALDRVWAGGGEAYLGTAVGGFPNLFLLSGPNTGLGHHSVIAMLEAQFGYLIGALDWLAARPGAVLEVRAESQQQHQRWLDARLARSVWNQGGCKSWYLTDSGRNTTLWPRSVRAYRRALARFDPVQYKTSVGVPQSPQQ